MIAVSDFSARKMSAFLGESDTVVIENLPVLKKPDFELALEKSSVIYVGRVAAEKGVDTYLEACSIANVPAEIWGDGPLLPELKAAWPEASFRGWVEPARLQSVLGRALVLVVPSLWYETYGMVVAEAAAAGVAVIVSDHGAAASLVQDGVTGLHFRAGDAADLAQKITRLRQDSKLAHSMGLAAYQQFWRNYEMRRGQRIARIENLYRTLLEAPA
jgi:glycosyltransferase involved in cell wall biosynthesis